MKKFFFLTALLCLFLSFSAVLAATPPKARTPIYYDGTKQILVIPGEAEAPEQYYYRNRYTQEWTTDLPEATQPGTYTVEYMLADAKPPKADKGTFIRGISIRRKASSGGSSGGNSGSSDNGYNFYYIGSGEFTDYSGYTLPATGFSTRHHTPLSVKPADVRYADLNMRIQIPTLSIDVELTGVPELEKSWAVEWLGDRAGLLSGFAEPGQGTSIIAGHNHLNDTQAGPFVMLFELEENDRIFVNTPDGDLVLFSVYANELLDSDDIEHIVSIADREEGSLVLITCENESENGGYLNRRAVFAKPMF